MENNSNSNNKFELEDIDFELKKVGPMTHITATSKAVASGFPVAEAKCLIGEHGELMIAAVDFLIYTQGQSDQAARLYIKKHVEDDAVVSFPYATKDGESLDMRLRRPYMEVHCFRAMILDSKKDDLYKAAYTPFLKRLRAALARIDASGVEGVVEHHALRTPFEYAYTGKKVSAKCEAPAPAKVVEAIKKEAEQVQPDQAMPAVQAIDADNEAADTAALMSAMLSSMAVTNKLVAAVGAFLQARDNTAGHAPAAHVGHVVVAFDALRTAVAEFQKEVAGC